MDSETRSRVLGFSITIAHESAKYTFVVQTWFRPELRNLPIVDELFRQITQWTESLGRREIRCESERNSKAWFRRWRFKEISKVFAFNTDDLDTVLKRHSDQREREIQRRKATW